jgi:hypothetical protein
MPGASVLTRWFGFVALLLSASSASAQAPVLYASRSELRGLRRVLVYTGTETSARDNIIQRIGKDLPELRFVQPPDTADIVVVFATASGATGAGVHCIQLTTPVPMVHCNEDQQRATYGVGTIHIVGPDGQLRLVTQWNGSSQWKDPSKQFAKEFVRVYKDANR